MLCLIEASYGLYAYHADRDDHFQNRSILEQEIWGSSEHSTLPESEVPHDSQFCSGTPKLCSNRSQGVSRSGMALKFCTAGCQDAREAS